MKRKDCLPISTIIALRSSRRPNIKFYTVDSKLNSKNNKYQIPLPKAKYIIHGND